MSEKFIKLQPMTGKFLQCTVNGKQINVYLVDPATNKDGTDVERDDALRILAFKHPVAKIAIIKDKDGKYYNPLTHEDWEKIKQYREEGVSAARTDEQKTSATEAALAELVKTQTQLLSQMKSEIDELKGSKKAKGKKAKEEKTE